MPTSSKKNETHGQPRPARDSQSRPARGKPCGVENCSEITTKGKPFCSDHLDLVQRADALIAEVNVREAEIASVLAAGPDGWRQVGVESTIARDILGIIEVYGPQTIRGISRASSYRSAIVVPYVRALAARGLVRVSPTRVGCAIEEKVSLPGD